MWEQLSQLNAYQWCILILIITNTIAVGLWIWSAGKNFKSKMAIGVYKQIAMDKQHEADNLRLRINQTINKPYI